MVTQVFTRLYDTMLGWAAHKLAPFYLALVSFLESSFFPIPPDVMLAPMVLAKPKHAYRFALITTLASVIGGVAGYLIGMFAFDLVGQSIIDALSAQDGYDQVVAWFGAYGVGMIILAGVTPIPYKIFTIAAGVSGMGILPFVLGSLIGRSARFYLVAFLVKKCGPSFEKHIVSRLDQVGWAMLGLVALVFCIWHFS